MTYRHKMLLAAIGIVSLAFAAPAAAGPSYDQLKSKGFATSRFTQIPSGKYGWYLVKGDEKYFCRYAEGLLRKGNRIGNFTLNGQFVSMTIAQFRRRSRRDPSRITRYEEIVGNNPPPRAVEFCMRRLR